MGVVLLALSGCAGDEPLAAPPRPSSPAVSLTPAPGPSPSPTPTPAAGPSPAASPTPLSPYEDDPAVQGLRAYGVAAAAAVNARDLQLPALVAVSTADRAAQHEDAFGADLGRHFPGPLPFQVRAVTTVDASTKQVIGCGVENGYALTEPGGVPAAPLEILPFSVEVRLEDGVWKTAGGTPIEGFTCEGLTLADFP
jgi:hypothetical protein